MVNYDVFFCFIWVKLGYFRYLDIFRQNLKSPEAGCEDSGGSFPEIRLKDRLNISFISFNVDKTIINHPFGNGLYHV